MACEGLGRGGGAGGPGLNQAESSPPVPLGRLSRRSEAEQPARPRRSPVGRPSQTAMPVSRPSGVRWELGVWRLWQAAGRRAERLGKMEGRRRPFAGKPPRCPGLGSARLARLGSAAGKRTRRHRRVAFLARLRRVSRERVWRWVGNGAAWLVCLAVSQLFSRKGRERK